MRFIEDVQKVELQEKSLEVMKTLISFTAVKETGGGRDRWHFSALTGNVFQSLISMEAERVPRLRT